MNYLQALPEFSLISGGRGGMGGGPLEMVVDSEQKGDGENTIMYHVYTEQEVGISTWDLELACFMLRDGNLQQFLSV